VRPVREAAQGQPGQGLPDQLQPVNGWFDQPGSMIYIAALMGLLALAIDFCLPALPDLAREFGIGNANRAQLVITIFLIAFGVGHLFQGFLTDCFGRKPVILANLLVYSAAAAICATTHSFEVLLAARALQGVAASGCRVVATAVLRDVRQGDELARLMSFIMMMFTSIPVLAPFVGQALVLQFGYSSVFMLLVLIPLALFVVTALRLPETWPPAYRVLIRPATILSSLARLLRTADTVGYTAIAGILYGLMFGYIASVPQITAQVYAAPALLPLFLSTCALSIGVAAYLSSRLARSVGPRRVVRFALFIILVAATALCIGARTDALGLVAFQGLIVLAMFGNGLAYANCNVLAIQPHGPIAGVASAMVGGLTMVLSGILSHLIGQAFAGTIEPLGNAFLAAALLALVIERLANARRLRGAVG
jgi:DHA1 family bicyclomycin/chloramphenicol resistance-like MFS transporter